MRCGTLFILGIFLTAPALAACSDDDGCATPDGPGAAPGAQCIADTDCAAVAGFQAICVTGLCGLQPTLATCEADGTRAGCPRGFKCREITVATGTYGACLPNCGCNVCQGQCDQVGSCQPLPEMNCDPRSCAISRGPPLICNTPPTQLPEPYFVNVTAETNLDANNLDVVGNRLSWADIDGDGFPELFVHQVSALRDDLTVDPPIRRKRVLLNVAGPGGIRQFAEHTDASGYTATRDASSLGRKAAFAIFADVNNDGFLDVFSGTPVYNTDNDDFGDRSEILLGNGDGTFSLAPQSDTSPEERQATHAGAFLDYDLDGNIDLFVGNQYGAYGWLNTSQQDRLYRGDGSGQFTDVTQSMGLTTFGAGYAEGINHRPTDGVTVCDVDSDGDPDILTSSYGRQWNMLWENQEGTQFANIAPEVGFDADDEEDYSDNELFRYHCQLNPAAPECIPNPGAPVIACTTDPWNVGVDDQPWRLAGTTFTSACGDIDNDGDMDVFNGEIRHWYHGSSSDPSQLLLNDGNGESWVFTRPGNAAMGLDRTWPSGSWNEGDITAGFLDFDNDGRQDIYIGCSDYPDTHAFLFWQQEDNRFEDRSDVSGADHYYGNGIAFADYDRDGDLDIAIGSSTQRCSDDPACPWTRAEVHLYRNEVGHLSNWLAIRLIGAGQGASNVSAIGARIVVTTATGSQIREVQGGYGHFGIQHGLTQHFGLGAECFAEEVLIFWPNRYFTTSRHTFVPANYFVTIDEASGTITYEPAP